MVSAVSVIGFPILSFLLLLFLSNLHRSFIRIIGVGGIMASFIATMMLWLSTSIPHKETLWRFLPAGLIFDAPLQFGLMVDSLSLTMALMVSFVSSLIALYSAEYMAHEEGFARFFACINLFVAFMLLLVFADSLWLLFIGWEGVGLASYLLIGFYHREPKAVMAAMKAFITTRIGDVFLLFALFFAAVTFATLDITGMKTIAENIYPQGSGLITLICLCMLLGAAGKSAQLPLQIWLADAMWGPTPVSALIHAATMVTAGVYLLVRMSFLVTLSPLAQAAIMLVGMATLIMAGVAALAQTDLKRVLAYSTMSQIGLMFVAVGALAFQAAIFHLVTHAFFKALLFLSAGIIGHAIKSYDLNAMGGLRKASPAVFWLFLVGSAGLMGLPLVGSGFFSKEWIFYDIKSVADWGNYLFYGACLGTFLTAMYTTRMLSLAFFGEQKKSFHDHAGAPMYAAVTVLAIFSVTIGWLQTPHFLFDIHLMADFLSSSVPKRESMISNLMWLVPTIAMLLGAFMAYQHTKRTGRVRAVSSKALVDFAKNGLGFDWLYRIILVRPYQNLALRLQSDFIKSSYGNLVDGIDEFFAQIAAMHTGRLSHYLSFLIISVVALASIMVLS